jgi:flagellar basal-body rod protein FlgC
VPSLSQIQDIAVSGLLAQRVRMVVTSSNIANAQTTRTAEGGPYQRRDPVFAAKPLGGFGSHLDREIAAVEVPRVEKDARPGPMRFDPGHPDANPDGYVQMPNVNMVEELTNLMSATRSFEANLLALRKAREMGDAALRIGR